MIDLSCRRRGDDYVVVTDRWQTFTDVLVDAPTIAGIEGAAPSSRPRRRRRGPAQGIDTDLVERLGRRDRPHHLRRGARSLDDLDRVERLGAGRLDLTIGSALD